MANLEPGTLVVLKKAPSSLLEGLPKEDRRAIKAIVGQPVLLAGFSYGKAELEFTDSQGDAHTIWVQPDLLAAAA